jgi:uncharacterized surface protein with fasciclin (FAS1) repeats
MRNLIIILSTFVYFANALWIPSISKKRAVDDSINDDNYDDSSAKVKKHDHKNIAGIEQEDAIVPYINFIKELSRSEVGFSGIHDCGNDEHNTVEDNVKSAATNKDSTSKYRESVSDNTLNDCVSKRPKSLHDFPNHVNTHPPWKHLPEHNPGNDQQNLLEVIGNDERFKTFTKLVSSRNEIADKLQSQDSELTVFAPSDCAFGKLHHHPRPPPEVITKVLEYHIISEKHLHKDLSFGDIFETNLILDSLGGKPQVLKVFKFHNQTVSGKF